MAVLPTIRQMTAIIIFLIGAVVGSAFTVIVSLCVICDRSNRRLREEFHRPTCQRRFNSQRDAREAQGKVARYSADAILHRIRWLTNIETSDAKFRVNDHWSAFYARMLLKDDPSFTGFFELRKAAADRKAA